MKQKVITLLSKILKKDKEEIRSLLEIPPSSLLGDFAFPCFTLARDLKKNPADIAKDLSLKILRNLPKEFEKVEPNGPYINFFLNKSIFANSMLQKVLKEKDAYGSRRKPVRKNKILIEHTSINPNASPHVGRARNALIGDSLARILRFQKYRVETHFYVNDLSKQVAMLVHCFTGKEKFPDLLGKYSEISKKIENNKNEEKQVLHLLSQFDQDNALIKEKFSKVVALAIEGQKKILDDLGIFFDYFDYESSFVKAAKILLDRLQKTGKLIKDEFGREVLNQEGFGLEKKMKSPYFVLTRGDGTGLYPLRDLAYSLYKGKRADRSILVLGEDQKLYFQQLKVALRLLGVDAPEVVHYSYVLIQTHNRIEKMSTRKGELVLIEDFMRDAEAKASIEIKERKSKGNPKKIALAAVKFSILKNDPNRNIIFNLSHALSFEGETGPYLLYSYARASSILIKARASHIGKEINNKKKDIQNYKLEEKENQLLTKIAQFPEIVEKAEYSLNGAHLANYSFQLAQIFNEFYHTCPVIKSDQEEFRLNLVQAFRYTLKNAVSLLGIEVIDKM